MITRLEATQKVQKMLLNTTYEEMAKKIGITKPTLYVRLADHNWKLGELSLIEKL